MIQKLLPLLIAVGMSSFEFRMKRVLSGIGLFIASALFAMLAVVCVLASMFFALADMDHLITPSLITGGIIILIAILTFIEGKRIMHKKPLRQRVAKGMM